MRKFRSRSGGAITFLLMLAAPQAGAQPPDSCLIPAQEYDPVRYSWNPQAVLIDICDTLGKPELQRMYGRQWFGVTSAFCIVDLPPTSPDSLAEFGPEAINPRFENIRSAFLALQDTFGRVYLHKPFPDEPDTGRIENRLYNLRFANVVNVWDVEQALRSISVDLDAGFLDYPGALGLVRYAENPEAAVLRLIPGAVRDVLCLRRIGTEGGTEGVYAILDVAGHTLITDWFDWNTGQGVCCIDLSNLASGQYFLRYRKELHRIILTR